MLGAQTRGRRHIYTPAPRGHIQVRPKETRAAVESAAPASFFGTAEEIVALKKRMEDAEIVRQQEHDTNERIRANEHAQKMREVSGFLESARGQLQHLLPLAKGEPGEPGADADESAIAARVVGKFPKLDDIVGKVLQEIPKAKNGETPLVDDIVQAVLALMPEPEKGHGFDEKKIIEMVVEALKEKGTLKVDHIDGLDEKLKQLGRAGGYIHGGGVTALYAGSGVTVTRRPDGNYTISSSGGGVGVWQTPVESPNGVLTAFTVGSPAPTDVVADGISFYPNAGYVYAAGQITFSNPPTQYVRYR